MINSFNLPEKFEQAYEQGIEYAYAFGRIRVIATDKNKDAEQRIEEIKEVIEEVDRVKGYE